MPETVKLNLSIQINTSGEVDTEIPLDRWNAMTNEERSKVVSALWLDEAGSNDSGGVSVVTPGAVEA